MGTPVAEDGKGWGAKSPNPPFTKGGLFRYGDGWTGLPKAG